MMNNHIIAAHIAARLQEEATDDFYVRVHATQNHLKCDVFREGKIFFSCTGLTSCAIKETRSYLKTLHPPKSSKK